MSLGKFSVSAAPKDPARCDMVNKALGVNEVAYPRADRFQQILHHAKAKPGRADLENEAWPRSMPWGTSGS